MVDVDPKDIDDMRKDRETVVHLRRKPVRNPELTGVDREIVPETARLTIPLTHSRQLRKIADQLRALAGKMEMISTDTESRERSILMEAWLEIRMTDRRIRNIRSGKMPDGQEY